MKRLRSESGFASLLAIFLIILISGVSYGAFRVYSQQSAKNSGRPLVSTNGAKPTSTADPTAGWKTYTGAKYSLKYPSDWQELPPISSKLTNTVIFSNRTTYTATDAGALFLLIDSHPGNTRQECYTSDGLARYTTTETSAKLGNLPAIRYIIDPKTDSSPRYSVAYFAVSDGNCYTLTLAAANATARDAATAIAVTAATTFKIK